MKQILCHLFLPHESNNHRPKILHHSFILLLIIAFFVGQFFLSYIKTDYPAVLGSSIDISTQTLLEITNQKRRAENLPPLKLNSSLSQAAGLKADYMFQKNFWAHNAPDGTTPWYFFKKVGYTYTYAGENLARGFTDSSEVVEAWMDSPTHRENMLSSNYTDIGFAIKKGKLLGEDTTLIVEMFGSQELAPFTQVPKEVASASEKPSTLPAVTIPQNEQSTVHIAQNGYSYALKTTSLISNRLLTLGVGFFVLVVFIFILALDIIIIERKKIVRVVGHNIDHIFFLGFILIIMFFSLRGIVL